VRARRFPRASERPTEEARPSLIFAPFLYPRRVHCFRSGLHFQLFLFASKLEKRRDRPINRRHESALPKMYKIKPTHEQSLCMFFFWWYNLKAFKCEVGKLPTRWCVCRRGHKLYIKPFNFVISRTCAPRSYCFGPVFQRGIR
jgi:hypothetical protein